MVPQCAVLARLVPADDPWCLHNPPDPLGPNGASVVGPHVLGDLFETRPQPEAFLFGEVTVDHLSQPGSLVPHSDRSTVALNLESLGHKERLDVGDELDAPLGLEGFDSAQGDLDELMDVFVYQLGVPAAKSMTAGVVDDEAVVSPDDLSTKTPHLGVVTDLACLRQCFPKMGVFVCHANDRRRRRRLSNYELEVRQLPVALHVSRLSLKVGYFDGRVFLGGASLDETHRRPIESEID